MAVVVLLACSDTSGDPTCHYDCFGAVECHDGEVVSFDHVPVACADWTGQCPRHVAGRCLQGCAAERMAGLQCPMEICRENHPKRAGDPCRSMADCQPTPAIVRSDLTVENVYLTCDAAAGRCVKAAPASVADWLAPCSPQVIATLTPERRAGGTFGGALTDPGCSEKVCAYVSRSNEACVRQGCSRLCQRDDQCPPGATCSKEQSACADMSIPEDGYCKPGPRRAIAVDLKCP